MAAQSRNGMSAFAGLARVRPAVAVGENLSWVFLKPPQDLAAEPPYAGISSEDHHKRGLELAEEGTRQDRPQLLEQAKEEFEAALEAVPVTDATIAFRRRATINLASVLGRLGQSAEAVRLLEGIRERLTGGSGLLLDEARALYTLGNVYMTQGRVEQAIDTYQTALGSVGGNFGRADGERLLLRGRILSNLGSAYVDTGRAEEALGTETDPGPLLEATTLLSQAGDDLDFGRALRVQGEAFHRRAERLGDAREWAAAERSLRQAIEGFEGAREKIWGNASVAVWAEVTATLAGTESDLGALLGARRSRQDRQEGHTHLRRAVTLYTEAFPDLRREQDRENVGRYFRDALRSLLGSSPAAQDAWLGLAAGIRVLGSSFISVECRDLWKPILGFLIHETNLAFSDIIVLFGVGNTDQKIARLTEFIASLGLSESDAAPVLNAVFERLGWSSRLLEQAGSRIEAPSAEHVEVRQVGWEELFENVPPALQSKRRQKYVFAPELLDNIEAFTIAQGIANTRNYKARNKLPLTPEEDAQGLMANSFVNQARTRRRRRRAREPGAG